MKHEPLPQLRQFLAPFPPAVQELALALRDVVLDELSPCHENIYDAYNAVAIGFGTSERLKDCICHIAVYAKHVNLGLNRGALLADPAGVLQGTGKWTRHITLKTRGDTGKPEIRRFLRLAKEQAGWEQPPAAAAPHVRSTVKAVYARRRRPPAPTS